MDNISGATLTNIFTLRTLQWLYKRHKEELFAVKDVVDLKYKVYTYVRPHIKRPEAFKKGIELVKFNAIMEWVDKERGYCVIPPPSTPHEKKMWYTDEIGGGK